MSQDIDIAVLEDVPSPKDSSRALGFVECAYAKLKVRIQGFAKDKGKSSDWTNDVEDRLDKVRFKFFRRFLITWRFKIVNVVADMFLDDGKDKSMSKKLLKVVLAHGEKGDCERFFSECSRAIDNPDIEWVLLRKCWVVIFQ